MRNVYQCCGFWIYLRYWVNLNYHMESHGWYYVGKWTTANDITLQFLHRYHMDCSISKPVEACFSFWSISYRSWTFATFVSVRLPDWMLHFHEVLRGSWRGGPNPIVFFKSQLKSHNPSLCCSNWNPFPFFYCFCFMNPSPSAQNPISQPLKKANPSSRFTPSGPSL